MKFYVQEDTSRQADFWIKVETSLNTAFAFSKICFDEKVAWVLLIFNLESIV